MRNKLVTEGCENVNRGMCAGVGLVPLYSLLNHRRVRWSLMKPRYYAFVIALLSAFAMISLQAQETDDFIVDAHDDAMDEFVEFTSDEVDDVIEQIDPDLAEIANEEPPPVIVDTPSVTPEVFDVDRSLAPAPASDTEMFPADDPAVLDFDATLSDDMALAGEEELAATEDFDIDRDPPSAGDDDHSAVESRRSFWGRLFGRKAVEPHKETREAAVVDSDGTQSVDLSKQASGPDESLRPEHVIAMQEEVRRQAAEMQAMRSFKEADKAISRSDFSTALTHLGEGMSVMPVRPQTLAIRENARKKQADCQYRLALNFYKEGRIAEAEDAIRRANEYYPADRRASKLGERIARDKSAAVDIASKPRSPGKTDEFVDKKARMNAAIKRGRQFMEIKEYEKAKYEFRSVLVEDPLNKDASLNLKKISEWEYNAETLKWEATQEEMLAQVRAAWTPPVRQEIAPPKLEPEGATIIPPRRRRLMEKLNTIIIPQLDFRQANIVDVVQYLVQQRIAGDPKSSPTERGVNLILNLKRPGESETWSAAPARRVDADPFALEEAAPAMSLATGVPSVTLSLRNILLVDAIKYITEVTGLKYRIEDDVVVITPSDVVVGTVITRTYKVQPTIQDVFLSGAPSSEGVGFLDIGASTATDRGDVKSFFTDAGVPFPAGTSIMYKQNINLLIVSNTEENLERLEHILAMLDVIPTQVEIEARFVEIGQKDLMELGVEWQLTDNWQIAQEAGAGVPVPLSARERIQVNKNTVTKGLRYLSSDGTGAQRGGNLAGILSVSSILTNPELTFILHALEQKSGVNLLSAPKVTTKSGANAEIKVVKELIYPTQFNIETADVTSGYTGIPPTYTVPGAFEVRDIGVVLNVTPVVSPDGYTIDLTMLPQVVELADWVNYGYTRVEADGSEQNVPMLQPVFHSRSIATSISIWDGQTVVMGGLITEGQSTTEDKIPFLGDIPLIGALFRSKSMQSEKRNLLIFVTARLVDPAGNKVQTATAAGATRQQP